MPLALLRSLRCERAIPPFSAPLRALAKVSREVGTRVALNVRFADTNLNVPVHDAAVAAQRAYAATLLELPPAAELGEGPMPDLHEVLADARWD